MASSPFPDPIPGILPFRTVTVVAGAAGAGKTALFAGWLVAWRDGLPILDHPTNPPTGVYYLSADRQWDAAQIWFERAGYPNIPHYCLTDDPDFDDRRLHRADLALAILLECVNKLDPQPGGHLLIDPLSPLFIRGDPNRARDVAVSMIRLSRLCRERNINITVFCHFGKQKGDPKEQYVRPQDRIAGSGAFAGFSDTQIYLCDPLPPKEPHHTLGWVPRHSKPAEFRLTRGANGLFHAYELFDHLGKIEQLLRCVPATAASSEVIFRAMQQIDTMADRTARRYLDGFVAEGRVRKLQRNLYERVVAS